MQVLINKMIEVFLSVTLLMMKLGDVTCEYAHMCDWRRETGIWLTEENTETACNLMYTLNTLGANMQV